jgi:YHS domain-containing protein
MRYFITSLFFFISIIVNGQATKINKSFFGNKAVDGKDIVLLYQSGSITDGEKQFVHEYNGAKWYFSGQKTLELFKENPKKYAPAYGGYCAWAVANGYTASVELETAVVVDEILYLNYNKKIAKKWSKDRAENILKANRQWPKLNQ